MREREERERRKREEREERKERGKLHISIARLYKLQQLLLSYVYSYILF